MYVLCVFLNVEQLDLTFDRFDYGVCNTACDICKWQICLSAAAKYLVSIYINFIRTVRRYEMTIYNLYIFDKYGTLLHYAEWNRIKQSGITKEEEAKLMYGMLFSIKSFVNKISPIDPKEGFLFYKTNKYALHYLETATGLKWVPICRFVLFSFAPLLQLNRVFVFRFVLNTDTAATAVKEFLQQYYAKIWMEYVVKNPLWMPGMPVTSDLFKQKSDQFIRQSALFTLKSVWNNWSVKWELKYFIEIR